MRRKRVKIENDDGLLQDAKRVVEASKNLRTLSLNLRAERLDRIRSHGDKKIQGHHQIFLRFG